ncbi:GTPase SAR1 family protein [Giardia muris]|uniref:GTPase SAR1 family protein n=1 Tax=Giardia muris TaxID=5742 RepID=A0A4Z1SR76_GIAMU|nr:GTPase SAR1 family protein [Giardia muris]|eukprot:TNJ28210.1 GTPase SAR1 family protein [Giardia muris]
MTQTVRIGFFGPSHVGKSTIVDYYAEVARERDIPPYSATVGVRILEIDKALVEPAETVSVQLWDISGDSSYEYLYNRIAGQLDGIVFVLPATELNITSIARRYFDLVTPNTKFATGNLAVAFAHNGPEQGSSLSFDDRVISSLPVVRTSVDGGGAPLIEAIDELIHRACAAKIAADNNLLVI